MFIQSFCESNRISVFLSLNRWIEVKPNNPDAFEELFYAEASLTSSWCVPFVIIVLDKPPATFICV